MLLAPVDAHTILKNSHIEKHLHPIVFLWFYLALDGILIRLARLHFNEAAHVTLHIVESPLDAQGFADIRRFQHSIQLVEIVPGSQESFRHRLPDMFEMHPAILEKSFLLFHILKLLANSQFNGILAECLLHARQIIGRFLSCINPFIQKQIGNVTQQ